MRGRQLAWAGFAVAAILAIAQSVRVVRPALAPLPDFTGRLEENFTGGRTEAGTLGEVNGFEPCGDGFCLRPGRSGRLVYVVKAPPAARSVRFHAWMHLPAGGSNSLSVLREAGSGSPSVVATNVESTGDQWFDLAGRIDPGAPVEIAIAAENHGAVLEMPIDRLEIVFLTGAVPPLPSTGAVALAAALWGTVAVFAARRRWLTAGSAAILTIALACRYADVRTAFERPLDPDAHGYMQYAQQLSPFTPTGFYSASFGKREPLWIAVTHVWFRLVGPAVFHLRLLSVLLSVAVVWAMIRMGRRALGAAAGLACGLVFALNQPLAFESTRGLRLELELLGIILFLTSAFLIDWRKPLTFAAALGCAGGMLLLTRSTYGLPLIVLTAFASWRRGGSFLPKAAAGMLAVVIMAAFAAPHRYGFYKRYGDPFWDTASYARAIANTEFAGTPGFPTRAEIAIDGDMGEPMTLGHYIFALHSPREIVVSTARGYWTLFTRMGPCADPDGIASWGCKAVNLAWIAAAGLGLLLSLASRDWRWLALTFVVLELPVAFLYDRNILELYRHSYQALPAVTLAAVWAVARLLGARRAVTRQDLACAG